VRRDTTSTVLLQEWHLSSEVFDGDILDGPVPILFATDVEEASATLTANPGKAFKDLQRIMGRFFVPENIPADSAMDFIANPRYSSYRKGIIDYHYICSTPDHNQSDHLSLTYHA
jgi:hypothetical protein